MITTTMRAAQAVFPGYQESLNSYLLLVIDKIYAVDLIQLLLLACAGTGMCGIITAWTWLNLRDVARLRHRIYRIFIVRGAAIQASMQSCCGMCCHVTGVAYGVHTLCPPVAAACSQISGSPPGNTAVCARG
jgi:hypothetical protein